jgi:hypothetical protein
MSILLKVKVKKVEWITRLSICSMSNNASRVPTVPGLRRDPATD